MDSSTMASAVPSPKRQRGMSVRWVDLPPELWQLFASFLDLCDLARLAQTHRRGLRCAVQAMSRLHCLTAVRENVYLVRSMRMTISRLLALEKLTLNVTDGEMGSAVLGFVPAPDRMRHLSIQTATYGQLFMLQRFPCLETLCLGGVRDNVVMHICYRLIGDLPSLNNLHVNEEPWVPAIQRPLRALSLPKARFPSDAVFRAFWVQHPDLEELTLYEMPTSWGWLEGDDLWVMHQMRIFMLNFFATLGPNHPHLSNVKALARIMPHLRVFYVQHWMCYTFQRFVEEGRDLERLMELEQLVIENCYFRSMPDQPVFLAASEMLPLLRALSPRLQVLVLPRECFCKREASGYSPPVTLVNSHTTSVGLHINMFNDTARTYGNAQEQWLKGCFPHAQFQWWWRDAKGRLHSVPTASDLPTSEAQFKDGPEHTLARHPPYSKPFYS